MCLLLRLLPEDVSSIHILCFPNCTCVLGVSDDLVFLQPWLRLLFSKGGIESLGRDSTYRLLNKFEECPREL